MTDKTGRKATRGAIQYDEPYGIGCLFKLGVTGAVVVLPATIIVGLESVVRAVNSIDGTNFRTFFQSLWEWIRYGSSVAQAFVWVFGFFYCVLVWLWVAERYRWRRFLSGKRLWAASSIYFLVMEALVARALLMQRSINFTEMIVILIPIVFLTLTLPLWWMRTKDEP